MATYSNTTVHENVCRVNSTRPALLLRLLGVRTKRKTRVQYLHLCEGVPPSTTIPTTQRADRGLGGAQCIALRAPGVQIVCVCTEC